MRRRVKVEFEGTSGVVEFDGKLCVHSDAFSASSFWVKKEAVTVLQPDFDEVAQLIEENAELSKQNEILQIELEEEKAKHENTGWVIIEACKLLDVDPGDSLLEKCKYWTKRVEELSRELANVREEEAKEIRFKYEVGDKLRGKRFGHDYVVVKRELRGNPVYKIFSFTDDRLYVETEHFLDCEYEKIEEGEE